MATGFDIWGVVASVVGLLSLFQFIVAVVRGRLPRERLRTFDDTLEETESLLRSIEEEGLFDEDGGRYLSAAKTQIASVCNRARRLRGDAFAAQTLKQEITQWWRGLSREISVCCDDLKDLRAQVSTTSNERRKTLAQRQNNITPGDPAQCIGPPSIFEIPQDSSYEPVTSEPQHLTIEETKENIRANDDEAQVANTASPQGAPGTSCSQSDFTDNPPSYRRQGSLPSYASSPPLTTIVFTRYTVTSSDAARATRKLVKAYRRNLMVHNVPWQPQGAQLPHHGTSAAASARAVDRPSNTTHHWKLLEARSKFRLRPYVTVLSHEATLVVSPHATGTVDA